MPAEVQRLRHRVGGRDRRFLIVLASAGLLSIPVGLLLAHTGTRTTTTPAVACVEQNRVGVMGGGTAHYCGSDAVAFCLQHGAEDDHVAAQCVRLGFRVEH